MEKRNHLRAAFLVFAAAPWLAGCGRQEKAPAAEPPAPPPQPAVVETTPKAASGFNAIATLDGSVNIEIHARITGFLIRQDYKEGAFVKRDDLLFEIDPRPLQVALDRAKAALADEQAHFASPSEVDAARTAVRMAQSDLADTKIVAPIDGVGGRAMPGPGDLIHPGALLTTISRIDPIKAIFAVPKKLYLDNFGPMAKVFALPPEARSEALEILLEDGTPYPHRGKWDSIDTPVPASMGPVTASALFPNPDRALRPGQYVKIRAAGP